MRVSALVAVLQGMIKTHGDINVYCGDMRAPRFTIDHPTEMECTAAHGETYLYVD